MRQLATISLLFVYLLGNTEIGQIVNIPPLLSHYQQHHLANTNINFLDFLVMHYGGNDGTTTDDNEDNQLPFKQPHPPIAIVSFEIPVFISPLPDTPIILTKSSRYDKTTRPLTGFLYTLLQPPRLFS
jgi:hypothetical protein